MKIRRVSGKVLILILATAAFSVLLAAPASLQAIGTWTGEGGNSDLLNASNWSSFVTPSGNTENGYVHGGLVFDGSAITTSSANLWAGQGWTIPGGLFFRGGSPSVTIAADTATWADNTNSPIEMTPDCTNSQTLAVGAYLNGGMGYVVNNSTSGAVLNLNVNYLPALYADGTGNIIMGSTIVGPGTNEWSLANGSVSAGNAGVTFWKLGTGQITLNNPNGLSDAGASSFTFLCGTTLARQLGGTPFGTGSVQLGAPAR